MEKLRPQSKIGPKTKDTKDRMERVQTPEELEKEWRRSVFGKEKLLEKIKEALYISQNKNEYPGEELRDIEKMLAEEALGQDINLLERALRQNDNENIRELAFESAINLGKAAEMLDEVLLLNSLITLATKNLDIAFAAVENKSPSRKYARFFLLGAVKSKSYVPESWKKEITSTLEQHIEQVSREGKIDSKDIEIMEYLLTETTSQTPKMVSEYGDYLAWYLK